MKPQRTFVGNEGDYSVDNRGPEALKKDIDALSKMFDPTSVHESGEAGGIGADNLKTDFSTGLPVISKDGESSKLQTVLNMIFDALEHTYTKSEVDAKLTEETSNLIGAVDYESGTGIFSIKNKGGETIKTYDTPIEKIPANFKLAASNGKIYLVITNQDGTATKTNVSALIDTVSVKAADGDPILVSLSQSTTPEDETQQVSKTFTLSIQDASLGMSKFAPDVVAKFEEVKTNAKSTAAYASKAAQSAESAQNSANGAFFFKDKADQIHAAVIQEKEIIDTLKTAAESARNQANGAATLSKSYATGGTGSRTNEDTDNAKYYAEQAAASAASAASSVGGDFVSNTAFESKMQDVYNDINNKASKGEIPKKVSQLENDSEYVNKNSMNTYIAEVTKDIDTKGQKVLERLSQLETELPTKVSKAIDNAITAAHGSEVASVVTFNADKSIVEENGLGTIRTEFKDDKSIIKTRTYKNGTVLKTKTVFDGNKVITTVLEGD